MVTAKSIISRMEGLIDKSNGITEGSDKDLTSAVNSLALGYGNLPISYDEAKDGDTLYKVYFASGNFVHADDSKAALPNNGILYDADGTEIDEAYVAENHKNLSANPHITESVSLKMDSVDTNGGKEHRYVGRFPMYDLENKTYTMELEFFRNYKLRHRVYFACGTFIDTKTGNIMEGCGCDVKLPNLGLNIVSSNNKAVYRLVRQATILYDGTAHIYNDASQEFTANADGEYVARLKIVLKGGAKKNVTLYATHGEVYSGLANYWIGDVIPIDFEIYHTVATGDVLIAKGGIYQPADVPLVCGVGNYDALTSGQYYGIRNLIIYKGDITKITQSSAIQEITSATKMDSILANATISDIGKFYLYVGETTDKYENGALYRIANTEAISFRVEYITNVDNAGTHYATKNYIAGKVAIWGDYANKHEDFTTGSGTILWRNGDTIKLNGEEVSPDTTIINGTTYVAY